MTYVSLLGNSLINTRFAYNNLIKILTDPFPREQLSIICSPARGQGSYIYFYTYANNLLPNATLTSDLTTVPTINVAYNYVLIANNVAIAANSTVNVWVWDLGAVNDYFIHFIIRASLSYITTNLQISSDGTTWTTIGSVTGGASAAATAEIVKKATFRYIRLQGVNSSTTSTGYAGAQMAFVYSPDNYLDVVEIPTDNFSKIDRIITSPIDVLGIAGAEAEFTANAFLFAVDATTNKAIIYLDEDVAIKQI